jgi:hypothetical protein
MPPEQEMAGPTWLLSAIADYPEATRQAMLIACADCREGRMGFCLCDLAWQEGKCPVFGAPPPRIRFSAGKGEPEP